MRKLLLTVLIISAFLFTGCENSEESASVSFFAMDTYMTIEAYGDGSEAAVSEARAKVEKLDGLWSVTDEESELYAFNCGESAAFSAETSELLMFVLRMSELTDGAFDPTVQPLMTAWGFTTDENRVPDEEELAEILNRVGYEKIAVNGETVVSEEGVTITFGGAAKGAASDGCAEIMRENGISSALINLGGNIYAVGSKPDGSAWRIGIADPFSEEIEGNAGILSVTDCAVVTSGNYLRYFVEDGVTYGHIIDPETGYPVDNGIASVTVVSVEGRLADVLSTALYVMGREAASDFWREAATDSDFDFVIIEKSGEIYVTEGIAGDFSSEGTVHVVSR